MTATVEEVEEATEEAEAFAASALRSELSALGFHGRFFFSRSKGRGRQRKAITPVLLFGYGRRWYLIKEEGDAVSERIPWDEIAGECRWSQSGLDGNGAWPGDNLRSVFIRALWRYKRF